MKNPLLQVGAARSPSFVVILFACIGACLLLALWLFGGESTTSFNESTLVKTQMPTQSIVHDFSNSNSTATADLPKIEQSKQEVLKSTAELAQTNAQIEAQRQAIKKSEALQMELIKALKQLKDEFAETTAQLQRSNAKVENLAQREQSLLAQTLALTPSAEADNLVETTNRPIAYTVQLVSVQGFAQVEKYIDNLSIFDELDQPYFYYLSKNEPWYAVFYGVFDTEDQAASARAKLPEPLKAKSPLIRRIENNSPSMTMYSG
ncbi:MAG: septal ring-binding cell division protein DamX [Saprospiraceae bacterium]|jgi:septal ring-binding cell division protein DamX